MSLQETKLKAILNKETTVVAVSKELDISRQTIHKWLSRYKRFGQEGLLPKKRKQKTGRAYNRTSEEIETLVRNIAQTYWRDGVETLHDRMEHEYNISLNPSTI